MVPKEGIEPSLLCGNGILSPARLPIPPPGPDYERKRVISANFKTYYIEKIASRLAHICIKILDNLTLILHTATMFCDELKIKVIAGSGGNGAVSFRREKYVPMGGPDGGDSGHGGDIIIKVNPQLNTLSHLASLKMYKADSGVNGSKKNMFGKNAESLILEVPQGTIVYNVEKSQMLADLSKENDSFIIAKGGKGGKWPLATQTPC